MFKICRVCSEFSAPYSHRNSHRALDSLSDVDHCILLYSNWQSPKNSFCLGRQSFLPVLCSLWPWQRKNEATRRLPPTTRNGSRVLAHSGISYLAFGWVFFAAASLAFTGSGSFVGMESSKLKENFKKDITDFLKIEYN